MASDFQGHQRAVVVLWVVGLLSFPIATILVMVWQAPVLALTIFGVNIWMDLLAFGIIKPKGRDSGR